MFYLVFKSEHVVEAGRSTNLGVPTSAAPGEEPNRPGQGFSHGERTCSKRMTTTKKIQQNVYLNGHSMHIYIYSHNYIFK